MKYALGNEIALEHAMKALDSVAHSIQIIINLFQANTHLIRNNMYLNSKNNNRQPARQINCVP